MPATRGFFRGKDIVDCTIEWGGCQPGWTVMAAVAENNHTNAGGHFTGRFMGNASLNVLTVVPHHGKVQVRVYVNWHDELDFCVDLLAP